VGREKVAPEVVQIQMESDFRGSLTLEGIKRFKGRFSHSVGGKLQVQMGDKHIPILSSRCHGLRKPDRRFRGRNILGPGCLLG
jgi:hypothetical protein